MGRHTSNDNNVLTQHLIMRTNPNPSHEQCTFRLENGLLPHQNTCSNVRHLVAQSHILHRATVVVLTRVPRRVTWCACVGDQTLDWVRR
jgi:hypothetical protein